MAGIPQARNTLTMTTMQIKNPDPESVPETVRTLLRIAGVHDGQTGQGIGLSRNVTQMRRTGTSRWQIDEPIALADWLGVPVALLFEEPMDAARKAVSDYDLAVRFHQGDRRSTWTAELAGQMGFSHAA